MKKRLLTLATPLNPTAVVDETQKIPRRKTCRLTTKVTPTFQLPMACYGTRRTGL
jgi:hypothetical protein